MNFVLSDHVRPQQSRVHLIDATRISDGKLVYIKRVKTGDQESSIAVYLDQESLRQGPRNHSVPVLDLFEDSEDPTISYMVMPFLSIADVHPFETVGEVVDFCEQLLEVRTCSFLTCGDAHGELYRPGSCLHARARRGSPVGTCFTLLFPFCVERFLVTAHGRTS